VTEGFPKIEIHGLTSQLRRLSSFEHCRRPRPANQWRVLSLPRPGRGLAAWIGNSAGNCRWFALSCSGRV